MPLIRAPRFLLLPLAAGLCAIAAVALSAGSSGAQVPPVPTTVATPGPVYLLPGGGIAGNHSICGRPLPQALGGETISDPSGTLYITLSFQGTYSYGSPTTNVGQPAFSVCHQQTNSTVVISLATGKEVARTAHDGLGQNVLNMIVAGVRFSGAGGSTVASSAPTGSSSAGAPSAAVGQAPVAGAGQTGTVLRPPNTGDAGLR